MASNVSFSRLFDEWDTDQDISMVNLEANRKDSSNSVEQQSPYSPSPSEHTRPQSLSTYDYASTRSLLRGGSFATTTDYESVKSGHSELGEGQRTRQRTGVTAGIKRLWHKQSGPSLRRNTSFDGKFARGRPGLWSKQMLVDRSLRSMALFTAVCAFAMWIIIFSYLGPFLHRLNRTSTSVGYKDGESCGEAETRNVISHLAINLAATMILGCSNTYQQLITAVKVDDIRWIFSKFGDSKVGTNSPWQINRKKDGKGLAWLCWIFLISTSLPVHFLANSVVGPSFYIHMPTDITYEEVELNDGSGNNQFNALFSYTDIACWTALRAESYRLPSELSDLSTQYNAASLGNSTTFNSVLVRYNSTCTQYLKDTDVAGALKDFNSTTQQYSVGDCVLGQSVFCQLGDPQPKQCRMNVRMQAAFILGGSLILKAAYMIILNVRARHQIKDRCLTYGDVVVASVLDDNLKIKNECMLNSGDGWRSKVEHTCHKHCKDKIPSISGDSIGHCQKCKKFNSIDKSADLPHPSIAIKYKRSLLSNLGTTAITQMIILMFTSIALLGLSIYLIVAMVATTQDYNYYCRRNETNAYYNAYDCSKGVGYYLSIDFGTWGGFSSSASISALPSDSLRSEFLASTIANGPQFLYSLLYLLLIYNLSLVSMEHDWGRWELKRRRPRCTIVSGTSFEQSYFLQLPSRVILPLMGFAALMHWLLGQAFSTIEAIYTDSDQGVERSLYFVAYAAYPIFLSTICMIAMTVICWWAFTYTREGFIPQMYGSIRTCCASTTELTDFGLDGILWGDLGTGEKFRHAGFSSDEPKPILPGEIYCGRD